MREGEDNRLLNRNGKVLKHGRGARGVSEERLVKRLSKVGSEKVTIAINEGENGERGKRHRGEWQGRGEVLRVRLRRE